MIHHRHCRCVWSCLLLACGLATASFGQLPSNIVTSPDPSPDRAVIDAFVDLQVKNMLAADPAKWTTGRTLLMSEVAKAGITPGFLDVYADSINSHLASMLASKDARVRLNAAIVAARIAAKANNGRLAPVTQTLLKDNSDAVVLWGLQTAKYVVPALLSTTDTRTADIIAKEAVQATKDHMTPAVIEEAYRTLLLNPMLPAPDAHYLATINSAALSSFLPDPMALYEYRIKLYDDVDLPKQPVADTWASTFFVSEKVWGAQTPAQQGQTLTLMLALVKGAAKQQGAAPSAEMMDVIKRTGQAFVVVSNLLKKPALSTAADKVAKLTPTSAPDEVTTAIDNLDAAIKALNLPTPPAATARNP